MTNKIILVIKSIIILTVINCYAPTGNNPETPFVGTRTYGGIKNDGASMIKQTNDNGFIIVGYTESFGAGNRDIYLIRLDSLLDTIWTKAIGGKEDDYGECIIETNDYGFLIVGSTESYGNGGPDIFLVKTDSLGDIIWFQTYGGHRYDRGYWVEQTNNEGFIIAGWTESYGAGDLDAWIIKTDPLGKQVWSKTIGGIGYDLAECVLVTDNDEYLITGKITNNGGESDFLLCKLNSSGDLIWEKTYGKSFSDWANRVCKLHDNSYALVGYTETREKGPLELYIVKVDSVGDTIWTRSIYNQISMTGEDVLELSNGSLLVIADHNTDNSSLLNLSLNGEKNWAKTLEGANAHSFVEKPDGGLVIVGTTYTYGAGWEDIFMYNTNSQGELQPFPSNNFQ